MEKPANIKSAAAQNGQVRSDIKILLVDDREDNLFSIETILEKDNYTIVKARSGRESFKSSVAPAGLFPYTDGRPDARIKWLRNSNHYL